MRGDNLIPPWDTGTLPLRCKWAGTPGWNVRCSGRLGAAYGMMFRPDLLFEPTRPNLFTWEGPIWDPARIGVCNAGIQPGI